MLIQDLYEDSIKYEESLLAHYILFLLQEGEITLQSDIQELKKVNINYQRFLDFYKKNPLGFRLVKVFSLKHSDKNFIFVFAHNQDEAIRFFRKKYRSSPLNCYEYSLDTQMNVGNRFLSFREMRKEVKEFPTVIGFYQKNY